MNDQQKAIVLLMKSAITQQAEVLPEGFSLEQNLGLIKKHHMVNLIYDGAVVCGISPKDPAMQQLFPIYLKQLLKSEAQQRSLENLRKAFREAGIDHMLLKGSRMKGLYPKPELRYMGDVDILIRLDQYDRIRTIMQDLGYTEKPDSDHELPWLSDGLYVELHKRLIPSYNKDLFAYYGDGWKLAVAGEGCEYTMKPEDEWIYLFTHFAKHYRDGGVGCRYVVDLWLWRRNYPNMDEGYIRNVLQTMQIGEFYENTLALIDYWFADGPGNPTLDVITEFIFASGSWGGGNARLLSQMVRDAKHSPLGFSGRLVYLWTIAFQPADVLKWKYPVLMKHRWMLPLVWLYRPFHKVFRERKDLKKKAANLDALSQENMRQRREMLNLVGLDYNF